jgi:hypothetical protein
MVTMERYLQSHCLATDVFSGSVIAAFSRHINIYFNNSTCFNLHSFIMMGPFNFSRFYTIILPLANRMIN